MREYLAGVADADVGRILSATAVDAISDGVRFDLLIDRIGAFAPYMQHAPAEYPFFADITRTNLEARILHQVRFLAYSLLSDVPISSETIKGLDMEPDEIGWAQDFIGQVDPARLADLEVVEIRPADGEFEASDVYQRMKAEESCSMGAVDKSERVALVVFEGERYLVGFTLYRYGNEWLVSSQSSVLAGTDAVGIPQPVSE